MRVKTQKQILCLLEKIKKSIQVLNIKDEKNIILVDDVLEAVSCVNMHMKKELSLITYDWYGTQMEDIYKIMDLYKECIKKELLQEVLYLLKKVKQRLLEEKEVKYLIYFLPYKFSMWDSMESVWCAAKEDIRCDVKIMPIPYYTKNQAGEFERLVYEGESFSQIVPIIDYKKIIFQEIMPDIVYIHNPYDQYNHVTSVVPEFYSTELRKCANQLVYIPYYITGQHEKKQNLENMLVLPAMDNVDYIILQSWVLKNILKKRERLYDKAVVLGNPKIDAVRNYKKRKIYNWEKDIKGRKVILITTTLEVLLVCVNPMDWILSLETMFQEILQYKEIFFIWRPHPLTEDTLYAMRMGYLERYLELKEKFLEFDNFIIDSMTSLMDVYSISDALVSDGGSTLIQYVFTGKPVLSIYNIEEMKYRACDYTKVYMASKLYSAMFLEDVPFSELSTLERRNGYVKGVALFCRMIVNNEDPDKEIRLETIRKSVENANENCGEKIHAYILNEVIRNESVMVM